jgi:hypothetical protein
MKRQVIWLFLVLATAIGPATAAAQGPPPGGMRRRQQLERRVEEGFARFLESRLGLSEAEVTSLQEVMRSFREDRQAVHQAQASLRYRLRDPALADLDEASARDILAEMIRLQEAELDLYRREQTQLLTVLSPKQLVLFYRTREEWGRRIQELRGPGGPRGVAGPAGGGLGTGWMH